METFAELMRAYEHSGLGIAARSTTWLYPLANLVHVLGAALLVGAIAVFDVQVLRRAGNLRTLARATLPIAIAGLVIQLASGLILLSAEASTVVAERRLPLQDADAAGGADQRGDLPRAVRTPPQSRHPHRRRPPARADLADGMGPGAAGRARDCVCVREWVMFAAGS